MKKLLLKECWAFFFSRQASWNRLYFFKSSASFSSFQNLPSFTIQTKDIPLKRIPTPTKTSTRDHAPTPCVWRDGTGHGLGWRGSADRHTLRSITPPPPSKWGFPALSIANPGAIPLPAWHLQAFQTRKQKGPVLNPELLCFQLLRVHMRARARLPCIHFLCAPLRSCQLSAQIPSMGRSVQRNQQPEGGAYTHVWRPEVNVGRFPLGLSTLFWGTRSLTELGTRQLDLTSKLQRASRPHPPTAGLQAHTTTWLGVLGL